MASGPKGGERPFRPTILVVEDETSTAHLLEHILAREGWEVRVVKDGRAASQVVGTQPPPLAIVLDLMLPYLDGQELIRRIRGNLAWCEVPIVVLTAKTHEKDVVRALDAGAQDYLQKPFSPEELLARVRRCLRAPS